MTGSFIVVCGSTVSSTNPRKTYDSRGRSFHRVYTLGNHDVSRETSSTGVFDIPKSVHPDFPYAGSIGSEYWAHGYCVVESVGWIILVVNSVAYHDNEIEQKRGKIAEEQIDRIEQVLNTLPTVDMRIAVCHHHPIGHDIPGMTSSDLMVNGDRLMEFLNSRGFSLVIHGHKHYPRIREYSRGAAPTAVFAAGSFSAFSEALAATRNTFHLIELEPPQISDCYIQGRVHTWAYTLGRGWHPPQSQLTGLTAQTGFGFHGLIPELTESLADMYQTDGSSYLNWDILQRGLPQLQYLTPEAMEDLREELKTNHQLEFLTPDGISFSQLGRLIQIGP